MKEEGKVCAGEPGIQNVADRGVWQARVGHPVGCPADLQPPAGTLASPEITLRIH
jgi:hypothetical protein